MRNRQRWLGIGSVMIAMVMATVVLAGELTPPGPPGATMKTLQEIYDKLEAIDGKLDGGGGSTHIAAVPTTGQTTSYRTGDDGWWGTNGVGVAWPDPRFTVATNGADEVVADNMTGLMWIRNANHALHLDWSSAIDHANSLEYAGYTDWRLPNVAELRSLLDLENYDPALPDGHPFLGGWSVNFWTSTTYANDADEAWHVIVGMGGVGTSSKGNSMLYAVWPVRGGQ